MTKENTQDKVQESQDTGTQNEAGNTSDSVLLQEVMQKKEKIRALEAELAKRDSESEKRRVKKLEEDGKLKEIITEHSTTIEKLNATIESQSVYVDNYKGQLINEITSDEARKEDLNGKSIDFLEELKKGLNDLQPNPIANPKETLGAVRKSVSSKDYADMTEAERKEWHSQMMSQTN